MCLTTYSIVCLQEPSSFGCLRIRNLGVIHARHDASASLIFKFGSRHRENSLEVDRRRLSVVPCSRHTKFLCTRIQHLAGIQLGCH
jgi:hypothetical protein